MTRAAPVERRACSPPSPASPDDAEIAAVLGLSDHTVRRDRDKARASLRTMPAERPRSPGTSLLPPMFLREKPIGTCARCSEPCQNFVRHRLNSETTHLLQVINAVLLLLSIVKLVCEIALMALLGQGLLYVLAGARRDDNFFYQLLKLLTRPFTAAARFITPRQVDDAHVGFVAFFMLTISWAVVTFEKIRFCVDNAMAACR